MEDGHLRAGLQLVPDLNKCKYFTMYKSNLKITGHTLQCSNYNGIGLSYTYVHEFMVGSLLAGCIHTAIK